MPIGDKILPDIPHDVAAQARQVYFQNYGTGEVVTLTPGQTLILKTIEEEYKKELDRIREIPPEMLYFILKLAEAEHKCGPKTAEKMKLSTHTIKTQLDRARLKLGVKSNLQLLMLFSVTSKEYKR